jgi:hypothetical protein
MPVGVRLATHPAPNAHRVLQVDGTVSPNFRWLDAERTDDPVGVLREEGVVFDDRGRADGKRRVATEDLARLAGLEAGDSVDPTPES